MTSLNAFGGGFGPESFEEQPCRECEAKEAQIAVLKARLSSAEALLSHRMRGSDALTLTMVEEYFAQAPPMMTGAEFLAFSDSVLQDEYSLEPNPHCSKGRLARVCSVAPRCETCAYWTDPDPFDCSGEEMMKAEESCES